MKKVFAYALLSITLITSGCNKASIPSSAAPTPKITAQALNSSLYDKNALKTLNSCNSSVLLTLIDQGYYDYGFLKKGIFCDDASVLEEPRVAQDGVLSAVVLPTPDQQGYIIYVTTTDKMRYTYSSLTRQTIVENTETLYNAQNSDTKTKIYIKQCALALAMTYVDYLKPYSDYPAGMSCDNPTIQDGPTNKSGVLTSGIYPDPNNPDNVQVKATSDLGHTFLYDLQSNTFVQL